ncbi:ComF family protein [Aggregicoccus sp. 17bor-14]|nr:MULTISPECIES: ComF family protein [Myxococcaceae]MBF5046585.1 ComF family protein [Simulacricoccus sp. 17bor-14]MRI92296.1 ComF family protein [Aggregicoccus sp. 17bor-14]
MGRALLDLLYPPSCLGCARVLPADGFFCEPCDLAVERTPPAHCPRCAEPGRFESADGTCARCTRSAPPFARAWAPFAHAGPVARAIQRFKYEDHPELAPGLARLLAGEAQSFLAQAPRLIVALPLHAARFRERRYDQAGLLAAELARATGRSLRLDVLARTRPTRRQVGLSEAERALNVEGVFEAVGPALAGADVLLVDDVFTTGATTRAATAALRSGGAGQVQVLTLARAFSA